MITLLQCCVVVSSGALPCKIFEQFILFLPRSAALLCTSGVWRVYARHFFIIVMRKVESNKYKTMKQHFIKNISFSSEPFKQEYQLFHPLHQSPFALIKKQKT
jgi:hypothetical protein